ncbi:hypothetical protein DAMA08_043960 [Martiniozyma asiatica (nom. inval.)]|nr:hypothetical protein DAMA08_043960 [Martiniozyma asiatica]
MKFSNIIASALATITCANAAPVPKAQQFFDAQVIELATEIVTTDTKEDTLKLQQSSTYSLEFLEFINNKLSNVTSKYVSSLLGAIAQENNFSVLQNEGEIHFNKSFTVEYQTLLNWNKEQNSNYKVTYGYQGEKELAFFDYTSDDREEIQCSKVVGGNGSEVSANGILFNSEELALLAKEDVYNSLLAGVEINADGFFTCSQYKEWDLKFVIGDKTLSIPLINLSWNYYEQEFDFCEPMISILSSEEPYDLVFGEYALQNLITNYESKRLGLAANGAQVTLA